MRYKYMEKQVEGAKALAEQYPHMQAHQDIYKEHVEVLEKAKAFDRIKEMVEALKKARAFDEVIKASQKEKTYEQLGFTTSRIASEYWRDKSND
ncbi:hypothetical protein [Staphylococcus simulans]|uniref:hypothetical protein n=1 Tax=Staphylococcus simulans TaxID=1286 RepID=UPI0039999963